MTDAILVANAGSSSIKFAAYAVSASCGPALIAKGQIEGLRTQARLVCESAAGQVLTDKRWRTEQRLSNGLASVSEFSEGKPLSNEIKAPA
jgi:acetate kinase